jgi:hypothetical protein
MNVSYYKMSGDELKRIYKVSGLKSEQFAARIGLEKHQLYTQFSRQGKPVDMEIEVALKKVPDLAKFQQNLAIGHVDEPPSEYHPGQDLMAKALSMINETLQLIKDDHSIIKTSNDHIREEASFYRDILRQGFKEGAIAFQPKALKKN